MTEPVRRSTLTPPRLTSCLTALITSLALLASPVVLAAPEAEPETAPASQGGPETDTGESAAEVAEPAAVRAALEAGDLSTARELAVARSAADPSVDNLLLEAEVWRALGDYEQAKRTLKAARDGLGEDQADEREVITAQLDELEDASRGTRADEPASDQRERLDRARADRLAALAPKPPPAPEVIDAPKPVPIVKRWYFWVTLGAIVASAGAIVGIAASNAVQDNQDSGTAAAMASSRRRLVPVGGVMMRF